MSMSMSGMDMSMDNSTMSMSMGTAFTTVIGSSNLWFINWTPTTPASTVGACIGLLFLALFSRLLSAFKSTLELSWSQTISLQRSFNSLQLSSSVDSLDKSSDTTPTSTTLSERHHHKKAPPFIASIDLPRALIFTLQAFIGYLLMLAVMTFNTYFFIAILLGFGLGELSFGRFISHSGGGGDGVHM